MKLEAKELETLKGLVDDSKQVKDYILQFELEILKFQKMKEDAYEKLNSVNSTLQENLNEINEKYGPININLEDGSYEKIENDGNTDSNS